MKLFLISVCVALAAADVSHILNPPGSEQTASIVKHELDVGSNGEYAYSYETDNGIKASESGSLKKPGTDEASEVVQGAASWTSPEGEPISFTYIADENGYQPQGSHIPVPPPIPEAIARALQYLKDHPPPPEQ